MGTILLIEDHDRVRQALKELLQKEEDITVCGEAADATQALELLETLEPDLILIDVSLPRMDGLTLLRKIKERWPNQKCAMLSGHDPSVYAEQAKRAGALDYIFKDDIYNLIPNIQRMLKQ